MRPSAALALLLALAAPGAGAAAPGRPEPLDLSTLAPLEAEPPPGRGASPKATVLVFFAPGSERSAEALRAVTLCRRDLGAKPVRWLGVVSDVTPGPVALEAVKAARASVPVAVDREDRLYGKIPVRVLPTVVVLDEARRVAFVEPYRKVGLRTQLRAQVLNVLGDLDQNGLDHAMVASPSRSSDGAPTEAHRHLELARRLFAKKIYAKALEHARTSVGIAPTAAAYALQGEILAAEGDCAAAKDAFGAALKLDPADPAAKAGQARCP